MDVFECSEKLVGYELYLLLVEGLCLNGDWEVGKHEWSDEIEIKAAITDQSLLHIFGRGEGVYKTHNIGVRMKLGVSKVKTKSAFQSIFWNLLPFLYISLI